MADHRLMAVRLACDSAGPLATTSPTHPMAAPVPVRSPRPPI